MHLPSFVLRTVKVKAYDMYKSLSSQCGVLHVIGTQIFFRSDEGREFLKVLFFTKKLSICISSLCVTLYCLLVDTA